MALTFEQRRDEIHEQILAGNIGCPFAQDAARKDQIRYCCSPMTIDVNTRTDAYVQSLLQFSRNTHRSVLIALPEKEPADADESQEYAFDVLAETVASMRIANYCLVTMALELSENIHDDALQVLESDPKAERLEIFSFWKEHRRKLTSCVPCNGMYAPWLYRRLSGNLEKMFCFTMSPFYKPLIRQIPHPRFSPHFACIMNYWNDLDRKGIDMGMLKRTRDWQMQSVGYSYGQAYHLEQEPEVIRDNDE